MGYCSNFYLKEAEEVSGNSLIYLQFLYNGRKLVFSFGQSINPNDWKAGKQRLKKNTATTADGKHLLNDLLDNLEKECLKAYNTEIRNGVPMPTTLRKYLIDFMNQNSDNPQTTTLKRLIDRFKNNEIKHKGRDKSKNTLKTYGTVPWPYKWLRNQKKGRKIDFDSITLDFYYRYTTYLKGEGLSQNSIAKDIKIIKVFMAEAVDLGYTNNLQFKRKKFSVSSEETDAVFLTDAEIMKLYKHNFTKNKRLEQAQGSVLCLAAFVEGSGIPISQKSNLKVSSKSTGNTS